MTDENRKNGGDGKTTPDKAAVILENEILRAAVLPFWGGKITSLFHKKSSFEAAAQKGERKSGGSARGFEEPGRHGFARYAYGFDDAFPNIDEEVIIWNGKKRNYPDHGEIWRADFQILEQGEDFLTLCWESPDFSYRYEKKLNLLENSLRMCYNITNVGKEEFPAIWTWHGLMRYEENMEILLPEGTRQCRNVLAEEKLGNPDTIYPCISAAYDFTKVPPAASNRAVKYYVEPKDRADKAAFPRPVCCGFFYPSQKMRCLLHYDAAKLPYLGVWITAGGFLGDYNCALEPADGFYDSIRRAAENRRLPVLLPGEKKEFELTVSLDLQQEEAKRKEAALGVFVK